METVLVLHKYQTGVAAYGLLITPTHPRETLTFLVYHQPSRRPVFSLRPSSLLTAPTIRYVYAAEMVPYDPEVANPAARHYRRLKRLTLQEASRLSGLPLKEPRHPWHIYPPGTDLATPRAPASRQLQNSCARED